VHVGDFVVASGDTPLRSLTCLERALAASGGSVALTLLRNGRRHEVTVAVS
jgi:hypothetical protein